MQVILGIRTFNSETTLDKCLNSVLRQSYRNIHTVVYDDNSSDQTPALLTVWKNKLEQNGIGCDLVFSSENEGCGKSFYRMGSYVSSKIKDDDIFMMLDSDDSFTSDKVVENVVNGMQANHANICIAGFNLSGDMGLVLNWDGGTPHNNLSHELAARGATTVDELPKIASHADSIGWTKIVTGDIFKQYMKIFPEFPRQMKVCEDFPSLAMLLFKKARITGLKDNAYDYFKHPSSSTAQPVREDFTETLIGFLKILQQMQADNKDLFIDTAVNHINDFLEVKYKVISDIVDKKNIPGFSKSDFQKVFKEKIDCSKLTLYDNRQKAASVKVQPRNIPQKEGR